MYQLPFFHKAVAFLSVEKLEAQGLSGTNCSSCACSPTSLDKGCDICGDFIDSRTFCFDFERKMFHNLKGLMINQASLYATV